MATPSDTRTNATRVYDELRAAIIDGELAPGSRLRTEALASRLGASRTPVREALVQLEGDGLVELEPRRGAVVRPFPIDDLADLYDVRALLEAHAASRAATRADAETTDRLLALCDDAERDDGLDTATVDRQIARNEEFHALVVTAAGSPRLGSALRGVAGIPRSFKTAFWTSDPQRRLSLSCHREIAVALRDGSPERAASAMRLHILSAKDYLLEVESG